MLLENSKPFRPRLWSVVLLASLAGSGFVHAETRVGQEPGLIEALTQVGPDCGERKTVVGRIADPDEKPEPPTINHMTATAEDWAEYERKVRAQFGLEPADGAEAAEAAPEVILSEGCALDEWYTDPDPAVRAQMKDPAAFVVETGKMPARKSVTKAPKSDSQSGKNKGETHGQSQASQKEQKEKTRSKPLLDRMVVRIAIGLVLLAAAVTLIRYAIGYVLGYFFRRRTCRVDAKLVGAGVEHPGEIIIIGKRGFRFSPLHYADLDKALASPTFIQFALEAGGVRKEALVSPTTGTSVVALFDELLTREEQNKILAESTIPVKIDRWKRIKAKKKVAGGTVRYRLWKLNELRKEQMAHKLHAH